MAQSSWTRGRVLGRGSTATVSLASTSSSVFAVKSAELSQSFFLRREQQIHSSISSSPFVISYLGFDITKDSYNLFLEFAPGGSLSDEIRTCKLDEPAIRARTRDVLMGLAHLHSINLVHGDVKSQNILIAEGGRAKIGDLGCARFADGEVADRGKFMGTPMFISPEVARGEEEQGLAADIWAVGCTVIEMATGRAPWPDASDPVSLLHRIAYSDDTPEVPEWLSEEGKDFLDRCLRRRAEERWSADELLTHPFVANSTCERKWASPKSTLDRSFWDSLSLSETEEDEPTTVGSEMNRANPIEEFFSSSSSSPNWTWGDSWLTVRADDADVDENQEVPVVVIDDDVVTVVVGEAESQVVDGISEIEFEAVSSSIGTTASSEELLIIRSNQDDYCRVISNDNNPAIDNCRVISCDNQGYCNSVTMLWISNWIVDLVPVVILVLSSSFSLLSCLISFTVFRFLFLFFLNFVHISPLTYIHLVK